MAADPPNSLALTRLCQLISPSLPIGGYSWSQGIEWAVEAGWIDDAESMQRWLEDLMFTNQQYLELPVLKRMLGAWELEDLSLIDRLNQTLIASRETCELRLEENSRARAFHDLLQVLLPESNQYPAYLYQTHLAGFSFACQRWSIGYTPAAQGWLMSWIENLALSGVKLIPLGQTAGQGIIFNLGTAVPEIVATADRLDDEDIGASSMAMAIASANHETQYTRLFRS